MNHAKLFQIIRSVMLFILKYFILFAIFGSLYVILEMLFRGYSNISMFILGGLCGVIIGGLNNWYSWELPVIYQMAISSVIITTLEYITGYIVNIKLGWEVWDYSDLPLNLNGQICLWFSLLWFFLSLIAILLDDWLRYILFNEPIHSYIWFNRHR